MPSPLTLALLYALAATAWIVLSDRAVAFLSPDVSSAEWFQTAKGLLFVWTTALVLWGLLSRHSRRLHAAVQNARRSEGAARTAEERHQIALALAHGAARLGVWRHDFREDRIVLDPRAREHLGFATEPEGLADALTRVHPEDCDRVAQEYAAAARPESGGHFASEVRIVPPTGETRWLSIHARLLFEGEAGERRPTEAFGTTQDITDRKRSEQALRESEERLRQAQKMEAVGQLAGGVAHDFNNILVVIQGHVELMQMDDGLPPALRESCDEIASAAERAAGLTRQLLLFGRRQRLQFEPVDLNQLVGEAAAMLRRVLGENIELEVHRADRPLLLHADRAMMHMLLLNLAVNARDAMRDGGTLVVRTSDAGSDDGGFARLEVRDDGSGIPADVLPRIFEPFFTTKAVGKGTGLGLATVFGVVREHGGTIDVESEVGHGTTFHVLLPLQAGVPVDRPPSEDESAIRGTETLLLVEDETAVRHLIAGLLTRLGYRVLPARSGVEALEIARAHHGAIDLAVTDVVMPGGMSGFELGRRLALVRPGTKVIYTSGFSTEIPGDGVELKEGMNFLPKPFRPWTLARLVRERLDDRAVRPGG